MDYRTQLATESPPYGAFEDCAVFKKSNGDKFILHQEEFNFLGKEFYKLFKKKKINYLRLLKIWNEAEDFNAPDGTVVNDVKETLAALAQLELSNTAQWASFTKTDRDRLVEFLSGLDEVKVVSE